jgi:Lon protease-like protein
MAVMPMFPLGSVLLPGAMLPLHVFEPRYQQLVRDCVDAPTHEFGVVLIDRGQEVGGGDSRLDVGVVAEIMQVASMDGGRFAVVALGTGRIRVTQWLADDPYPRAEVEQWPDGDGVLTTGRLEEVAARVKRCLGLSVEMGDRSGVPDVELSHDPTIDTFLLAAVSPFGPADQYAVLCAADPVTRLELIDRLLGDVEAGLRFRLG